MAYTKTIFPNFNKDEVTGQIIKEKVKTTIKVHPLQPIIFMESMYDEFIGVKLQDKLGNYLIKTNNKDEIDTTHFYLPNNEQKIFVDSLYLGELMTIEYYSIGAYNFSDKLIATQYDNEGNVTELLSDIITKGKASIDFYNGTGSAIQLLADLTAKNIEALTTLGLLNTAINTATIPTIQSNIVDLNTGISNINASILDITYNIKSSGAKGDGITDDTLNLKTFFTSLLSVDKKKKVIFPPNKTYCISDEIEIKSSNLEIDFNGSSIKYTGSKDYDYTLKNGVIKFRSTNEEILSGVLEFDPLVTTTLGINGQFNKVSTIKVTQAVFDKITVDQLIGLTLRVKNPPYTATEFVPTLFSCAKVLSKDIVTNKITLDYYSPYDWSSYNNVFTTNKITLYNSIKNISIKNYNFTATSTYLANIAPLSFTGVENIKVEDCKFEKNLLPCIHFIECNNFQVDSCEASNPIATDSGKGYLVQSISSHFGRVKNVMGNGMRHLVDFSGGWDLLTENALDINTVVTTASFDCHGQGEHSITYRNCKGSFCFGNGRTQFESTNANILIDKCDVVSIHGDCGNDVAIKNSTVNFNPTAGVGFKSLLMDNCKILLYDVTSADTYIKSKYGTGLLKEDTFITIVNSSFIPMSKTNATNVGINLLNFGKVIFKNNIIKSYTHLNTLEITDCTKTIIQGNTIDNCIIDCNGEFDLFDNEITIRSNKSYILLDNASVTGYKRVNIDGNTFIMSYTGLPADDVKFMSSNSQGNANPLHVIVSFNNNYFQNTTKDCTYFLQTYANLTWHVYSIGNISRQAVLPFGSSPTLFPVTTGIVVIA